MPIACTQHRRPHFVNLLHGGVKRHLRVRAKGAVMPAGRGRLTEAGENIYDVL